MGSWGVGLYQDDSAADLRKTIALLSGLPESGDRILQISWENYGEPTGLSDAGGPTFWLVLADQFERRGIDCKVAFARAIEAIETGADLRDLEARGAEPSDLKKRAKVLAELAHRLHAPRPVRVRTRPGKSPPFVVETGDVYRFPTMRGKAVNPWLPGWERSGFKPDGWGALLVFAQGRVFAWFPWAAGAALTVSPAEPPSLEDVVRARFISQHQSGNYFAPRRTHLKRMGMESIGRLRLDRSRADAALPKGVGDSPQAAVLAGWSFLPEARSWTGTPSAGVEVADLLDRP